MIRLIDSLATKYYQNECLDETERKVFAKLRYVAANIYLYTECIKFQKILDAVILSNKSAMPYIVEKSEDPVSINLYKFPLIRYTPSEFSITVLPENYFQKEKVNA